MRNARQGLAAPLYDEPGDGALWIHGSNYKARVDAHGLTFIPFLGSSAPRNFPVAFELRSASIGGATLPAAIPSGGS